MVDVTVEEEEEEEDGGGTAACRDLRAERKRAPQTSQASFTNNAYRISWGPARVLAEHRRARFRACRPGWLDVVAERGSRHRSSS